jgi:hypothetical protein
MSFKALPGFRQLAFVLVFCAAAGAAFLVVERVPGPVVDRLIRLEVERLADKWREIVLAEIDDAEQVFRRGFVPPQASAQLNLIPRASDAFRFKLFRPNGAVFWSTRPTDVGNINTHDYFEEIVARGGNYYLAEYAHPSEVFGLTLPPGKGTGLRYVTEVYRPVMADGAFAGAMEFYADMTDMRAAYMAVVTPVLGGLMGLGLLMLGVVAGAIARSGRLRMREMERRAEKEQELLGQQVQLAREVRLLGDLNEWLQSSRSLDELFDMVSQFLSHLLPNGEGSLYVYSNSRDVLDGAASWNVGSHQHISDRRTAGACAAGGPTPSAGARAISAAPMCRKTPCGLISASRSWHTARPWVCCTSAPATGSRPNSSATSSGWRRSVPSRSAWRSPMSACATSCATSRCATR